MVIIEEDNEIILLDFEVEFHLMYCLTQAPNKLKNGDQNEYFVRMESKWKDGYRFGKDGYQF